MILTKRTNFLNKEDCVKGGRMYQIEWLEHYQGWVVTSDSYPELSWLDHSPFEALKGCMKMIEKVEACNGSKIV